MSVRVQVILEEAEAAQFKHQAKKDSLSLSRWLKEAGKEKLAQKEIQRSLKDESSLKEFFESCDQLIDKGKESDWIEHKRLINEGYSKGANV